MDSNIWDGPGRLCVEKEIKEAKKKKNECYITFQTLQSHNEGRTFCIATGVILMKGYSERNSIMARSISSVAHGNGTDNGTFDRYNQHIIHHHHYYVYENVDKKQFQLLPALAFCYSYRFASDELVHAMPHLIIYASFDYRFPRKWN